MRKLVVCNIISLDGFYSGPASDVMAMPFDRGFDDYNAERFRAAQTLLLGRKSYELFRAYWPAIADDASQPPIEREVSRHFAAIDKLVVSSTLTHQDVDGWGATRIVRPTAVPAEIAALKQNPGGDILVFGSRMLWSDLLSRGLVDELHLMIGAGVLVDGVRAFETKLPGALRLVGTRAFEGSSLFLAQYAIDKASNARR